MYGKILVPIDGSSTSAAGLMEGIKLAKSQGGRLQLVHVVNELIPDYGYGTGAAARELITSIRDAGRSILDAARALAKREGLDTEGVLLESVGGAAADAIIAQAQRWRADVIVMGTHGRRGLARLLMGSDAEGVVRGACVPVILVRPPLEGPDACRPSADAA